MSLESIWNGTVKTMIRLGVASLIGLTGLTVNYFRTHENVRAICIEDKCVYEHPDEETTHILNYLGGKEKAGNIAPAPVPQPAPIQYGGLEWCL